jgi:hypothetical protein
MAQKFTGWEKIPLITAKGDTVNAVAPIILSASRSTDLPAFYAPWFAHRLEQGYSVWVNPFNRRPQYVSFARARVIVFWSKNPRPLMEYLDLVDKHIPQYYFQFTVNDYDREGLEPHVPPLEKRVETFKRLAEKLGPHKVVWRFDPLILTPETPLDVLLHKVRKVGNMLHNHTRRLVFSFADIAEYKKVQNNLNRCGVGWQDFSSETMQTFARELQIMNREWGLELTTCGESIDLSPWGVEHGRCIDDRLMVRLFSGDRKLMAFLGARPALLGKMEWEYMKDKGQRKECGCIVSKDIGMYNTCPHLCRYCYANTSENAVMKNRQGHESTSESIVAF